MCIPGVPKRGCSNDQGVTLAPPGHYSYQPDIRIRFIDFSLTLKLDIILYQVHWCVLLSSTEPKSRVLLVGPQWLAWVFSIDLNSLQSSSIQAIDCYLHELICQWHSQEFLESFPYSIQHWITRNRDLGGWGIIVTHAKSFNSFFAWFDHEIV